MLLKELYLSTIPIPLPGKKKTKPSPKQKACLTIVKDINYVFNLSSDSLLMASQTDSSIILCKNDVRLINLLPLLSSCPFRFWDYAGSPSNALSCASVPGFVKNQYC